MRSTEPQILNLGTLVLMDRHYHTHTSLFMTVSGVVGGVGTAISAKPLLRR
jgi:hypothetical protein